METAEEHPIQLSSQCYITEAIRRESNCATDNCKEIDGVASESVKFQLRIEMILINLFPQSEYNSKAVADQILKDR